MYKVKAKHKEKEAEFFVRENSLDEIVARQVWEKDFYLDNRYDIKFGDMVIDIGAHIGTFTVLARSYGANIIAYEPEPENYKMLKDNLKLNNMRARIFKKAVRGTNGIDKLWIHPTNSGGHTFLRIGKEKFINVECIDLRSILADMDKCDLLKLDCEHSEYKILIGTDLSKIEKITMEYHMIEPAKKLVKYLKKSGFKIETFYGNSKLGKIQARRIR